MLLNGGTKMINATLIHETNDNIVIDSIICPHCGAEMPRMLMDDPHRICGKSYICYNCGAEEVVSPEIEEEMLV